MNVESTPAIDVDLCTEYLPDGTCCPCGKQRVYPYRSQDLLCYPLVNGTCCQDYVPHTIRIIETGHTIYKTTFECCECGASINGDINGIKVCNQVYDPCCEAYLPDGTCCPCGRKRVQWWPSKYECYPLSHRGRCCDHYVGLQCCECGIAIVNGVKECNTDCIYE